MRRAETILRLIRTRGQRELPVQDADRLLDQRDLSLRAYGELSRHQGALTPRDMPETVDGRSLEMIETIIHALRHARYRWTPVRRTSVANKSGQQWPRGLPTWSDKLLQ